MNFKRKTARLNFFVNLLLIMVIFGFGIILSNLQPYALQLFIPITIWLDVICLIIIAPGIAYQGYNWYQNNFLKSFGAGVAGIVLGNIISAIILYISIFGFSI